MIVDAVVDPAVIAASIAPAVPGDVQRGALPAAPIAPGPSPAASASSSRWGSSPGAALERRPHGVHHLRPAQDVALHGIAGPGPAAGPCQAGLARERGGVALRVDQPDLALGAVGISGQQGRSASSAVAPARIRCQPLGTVARVGIGLSGDCSGAGLGPRHDGAHRRELGGDRDAPGLCLRIEGHDGEGRHAPGGRHESTSVQVA